MYRYCSLTTSSAGKVTEIPRHTLNAVFRREKKWGYSAQIRRIAPFAVTKPPEKTPNAAVNVGQERTMIASSGLGMRKRKVGWSEVTELTCAVRSVVILDRYKLNYKLEMDYDDGVTRREVLGGMAAAGVSAVAGCNAISQDGSEELPSRYDELLEQIKEQQEGMFEEGWGRDVIGDISNVDTRIEVVGEYPEEDSLRLVIDASTGSASVYAELDDDLSEYKEGDELSREKDDDDDPMRESKLTANVEDLLIRAFVYCRDGEHQAEYMKTIGNVDVYLESHDGYTVGQELTGSELERLENAYAQNDNFYGQLRAVTEDTVTVLETPD